MIFPNSSEDQTARFKQWWKDMPLYTKFLLYFTIFLYLLTFISYYPHSLMIISLPTLKENYSYWSILTFQYQSLSIFPLIFSLISFLPFAHNSERKIGTLRYLTSFVINNATIGILYIPLIFAASFINLPDNISPYCSGLWPITMIELIIFFNKTPDEPIQFMCFPCRIKQKYYPWAFFLLFSLIFGLIFELVVGILVGYMSKQHIDLWGLMKWALLSEAFTVKSEEKLCGFIKNLSSFISVDNISLEAALPSSHSHPVPSEGSQPAPFSGPGYRLGSDLPAQSKNYAKFEIS